MRGAAPNEPEDVADNTHPQKKRDFSDGRDTTVKQNNEQDHEGAGDGFLPIFAERVKVGRVLRKTNRARGKAQWSLNQRLPDEEEGHQAAHSARTVSFAKKNVAATRKRHGRAELRPHESIEQRKHR